MNIIRMCAVIICLLLTAMSSMAQAGEPELIQHGEAEDVYQVTVNPDVSPFQVHLIYSGGPDDRVVTEMKVCRGDNILQTLPVEEMNPPYEDAEVFQTPDMNFDGYSDLQVLSGWGATGNQFWYFWLYDPEKEMFEYNEQLSSLYTPYIDEENKTVRTWADGGAGGDIYSICVFKWEGKELVQIYDEYQTIDMKTGKGHKVVSELRDGKMVAVRDVVGQYEEELKQFHKLVSEPRDGKMVLVRDVVRKYDEETGLVRWVVKEPRDGDMVLVRDVLQDDMRLDKTHQVVRELMDGKMQVVSDKILSDVDVLDFYWEGDQLEY